MNTIPEINTDKLALIFTELLPLTSYEWIEAMEKIRSGEYGENVCPTHDYCDANMYMQAAIESLGFSTFDNGDSMSEAMCNTWNEAWKKARAHWLTIDWKAERDS